MFDTVYISDILAFTPPRRQYIIQHILPSRYTNTESAVLAIKNEKDQYLILPVKC
jgi:hypothetical protein